MIIQGVQILINYITPHIWYIIQGVQTHTLYNQFTRTQRIIKNRKPHTNNSFLKPKFSFFAKFSTKHWQNCRPWSEFEAVEKHDNRRRHFPAAELGLRKPERWCKLLACPWPFQTDNTQIQEVMKRESMVKISLLSSPSLALCCLLFKDLQDSSSVCN